MVRRTNVVAFIRSNKKSPFVQFRALQKAHIAEVLFLLLTFSVSKTVGAIGTLHQQTLKTWIIEHSLEPKI